MSKFNQEQQSDLQHEQLNMIPFIQPEIVRSEVENLAQGLAKVKISSLSTKTGINIDCSYRYTEGNIDTYVNNFIRFNLGGFNEGCQFLLKNKIENFYVIYSGAVDNAEQGSSLDIFFDKQKQLAPDSGLRDDRKDVFDELLPVICREENCKAKILFPYNITNFHWLTGEIILIKEGKNVSVEITLIIPMEVVVYQKIIIRLFDLL